MRPTKSQEIALAAALFAVGALVAQAASQSKSAPAPTTQPSVNHLGTVPTTQPSAAATQPSSKQVMQNLLKSRSSGASIKPNKAPAVEYLPNQVGVAPGANKVNPKVLGIAPGEKAPKLLPEGSFIINRRGRLIRSKDGSRELFEFDADSQKSPEAPMILQACRTLQSMENIVQQRGDSVVFILSGQVHTYRGANFLMPTMVKIAPKRHNLGR